MNTLYALVVIVLNSTTGVTITTVTPEASLTECRADAAYVQSLGGLDTQLTRTVRCERRS